MFFKKLINEGNFLFRYRGQFPLVMIFLAIPSVFFNPMEFNENNHYWFLGFGIVFSLFGFLIRFIVIGKRHKFSSGRNRTHHHTEKLETKGWYSTTRNPLYFANYLIWFGLGIAVFNPFYVVILSLVFWIYIERIILAEETYLAEKFKNDYRLYTEKTNVFFPSFRTFKASTNSFSIKTVLKNEYPGISAACICFWFVYFLQRCRVDGEAIIIPTDIYTILSILLFALLMKSIKKFTGIFHEFD